jgi:hypothetical protein
VISPLMKGQRTKAFGKKSVDKGVDVPSSWHEDYRYTSRDKDRKASSCIGDKVKNLLDNEVYIMEDFGGTPLVRIKGI